MSFLCLSLMRLFLINLAAGILVLSVFHAWQTIRRMFQIARRQVLMSEMPLYEIQKYQGLDAHPAFGDPMTLVMYGVTLTSEPVQFLKRWLIYFPVAAVVNMLHPLTWVMALPVSFVLWLCNR